MTAADIRTAPVAPVLPVPPELPPSPVPPGPARPEDLVRHVDAVSARLARLRGPLDADDAFEDTRRLAAERGLPTGDLDVRLCRGLAQTGSLGPDESAEYRRNLRALFDATGVRDPARPTPAELYRALHHTGREVAAQLAEALPADSGRTAVFLGTDAEFLKPCHDLLAGTTDASRVCYVSRLALLGDTERTVLARTSREVFGPAEVTARGAAGRQRAWMDNGLVASQLARLITAAREDAHAAPQGPPFEELFLRRFAEEARYGTDQARRLRRGELTLYGTPSAQTDAVIRQSITTGLFDRVCRDLAGRLPVTGRPLTLVDIGANGTQPALLMGAARLADEYADVRVTLFTSHPGRWGRPGVLFRTAPATRLFALGTESVKTFATDYGAVAGGGTHTVKAVDHDQQLLAHFKHLAFHRAAWEVRAAR